MTSDDRGRSLADQAASWVPPWERATPAEPSAPAEGGEPSPSAEESPSLAEEPAAAAESSPSAEGGESSPVAEESLPLAEPSPSAESVESEADLTEADLTETDLTEADLTETDLTEADLADAALTEVDLPEAELGEAEEALEAAGADDASAIDEADEPYADSLADEAVEPLVGGAEVPPEESFDAALADAVLPEEPPQQQEPSAVPLALVADAELRGALEAILLVVEEPVSEATLAEVLEQSTERVTELLGGLADEYESTGRGIELRRAAGGWRFYTRPEYAKYVERFVLDGQQLRLTQAALETLAVVAYKQPVTRSRISAIRGVNCDGVIRTLVSRGLVEECGAEPDNGAFLYRTTSLFLEKLGLNSVEELPPLAPFLPDDVDEIADAPR